MQAGTFVQTTTTRSRGRDPTQPEPPWPTASALPPLVVARERRNYHSNTPKVSTPALYLITLAYCSRDVNATPGKRKRHDPGTDADDDLTDVPPEDAGAGEESQEDDFEAPQKKKTSAKGKGKSRGPPAPKRPRATKTTTKTPTRKPRKVNGVAAKTVAKGSSDAKITNDNALFSMCPVGTFVKCGELTCYFRRRYYEPERCFAICC